MKEERRLGRGIGEGRLAFAERDPEVPRTLVPPPTPDPGFEHRPGRLVHRVRPRTTPLLQGVDDASATAEPAARYGGA
ncbi:hypothetical protein ACF09H_11715 [Streptomyces sp. NPDC014983]|uniref:hypothetical protein n=1 Tax=Streptomyces sp. NPDC014983 TaxID=3364933 RepID=UPI0036FF2F19